MKNIVLCFVIIISIASIFNACNREVEMAETRGHGWVRGTVTDSNTNKPIKGARIVRIGYTQNGSGYGFNPIPNPDTTKYPLKAITDSAGKYIFDVVDSKVTGTLIWEEAVKLGYKVKLLSYMVGEKETVTVDYKLVPEK